MTNKQNDEVLSEDKNIYSRHYSDDECIKADGEKIPVKKDSKTVNDDIDDYIFTRKRRVKKTTQEENNTSVYSENYELVKRNRSNDKKYGYTYYVFTSIKLLLKELEKIKLSKKV